MGKLPLAGSACRPRVARVRPALSNSAQTSDGLTEVVSSLSVQAGKSPGGCSETSKTTWLRPPGMAGSGCNHSSRKLEVPSSGRSTQSSANSVAGAISAQACVRDCRLLPSGSTTCMALASASASDLPSPRAMRRSAMSSSTADSRIDEPWCGPAMLPMLKLTTTGHRRPLAAVAASACASTWCMASSKNGVIDAHEVSATATGGSCTATMCAAGSAPCSASAPQARSMTCVPWVTRRRTSL